MNDTAFTDFTASLISVYPIFRAAIFKAFDSHAKKLTRTQQIILLTMLKKETFSMSGLARSISTSNEQATRAITQLVESGMVLREKKQDQPPRDKYIADRRGARVSGRHNAADERDHRGRALQPACGSRQRPQTGHGGDSDVF